MSTALDGGFADPAPQAAFAFRAVMTAMARPGLINAISGAKGPAPLSPAAASVVLTLCDADTGIYLAPSHDTADIRAWLAFHTSAPIVAASAADFALGTWDALTPITQFPIGTASYPDRSATLIVESPVLRASGATLQGPGIKDSVRFALPDVPALQANAALFPMGLDFIFTAGAQVAALPRSTKVS